MDSIEVTMDWRYTPSPAGQPVPTYSYAPVAPSPAAGLVTPVSLPFGWAPARPGDIPPAISAPVSAALLGAVIGGANNFGRNMHLVQQGRMTVSQAMAHGLMHGAATSVATTTATLLTANVTDSDALHLAALAITAAGLSYLIAVGMDKAVKRQGGTESCP